MKTFGIPIYKEEVEGFVEFGGSQLSLKGRSDFYKIEKSLHYAYEEISRTKSKLPGVLRDIAKVLGVPQISPDEVVRILMNYGLSFENYKSLVQYYPAFNYKATRMELGRLLKRYTYLSDAHTLAQNEVRNLSAQRQALDYPAYALEDTPPDALDISGYGQRILHGVPHNRGVLVPELAGLGLDTIYTSINTSFFVLCRDCFGRG